jgi:hypothetical protein
LCVDLNSHINQPSSSVRSNLIIAMHSVLDEVVFSFKGFPYIFFI